VSTKDDDHDHNHTPPTKKLRDIIATAGCPGEIVADLGSYHMLWSAALNGAAIVRRLTGGEPASCDDPTCGCDSNRHYTQACAALIAYAVQRDDLHALAALMAPMPFPVPLAPIEDAIALMGEAVQMVREGFVLDVEKKLAADADPRTARDFLTNVCLRLRTDVLEAEAARVEGTEPGAARGLLDRLFNAMGGGGKRSAKPARDPKSYN
jgi:hypothetical protein